MFDRHLAGNGDGVGANLVLLRAAAQRHEHVKPAPSRRLDVGLEAMILELRLEQQRGACRRRKAVGRIEIEGQPVGHLEFVDAAVHHVHRNAPEIDQRQQRLACAPDDVVDVAARGRCRDRHRRDIG